MATPNEWDTLGTPVPPPSAAQPSEWDQLGERVRAAERPPVTLPEDQPMSEPERAFRRGLDTLGLQGPYDYLAAVPGALIHGRPYGEERARLERRAQFARERTNRGTAGTVADIASDTAGLVLFGAPSMASTIGRRTAALGAPLLERGREALGNLLSRPAAGRLTQGELEAVVRNQAIPRFGGTREAFRYGAAYGGIHGLGTPHPDESLSERFARGRDEALLGAALGPAIYGTLRGASGLISAGQRGAARVGEYFRGGARERARMWEDVGIDPPTPIIAPERAGGWMRRLSGTAFGGNIRRGAARGERELGGRIEDETLLGTASRGRTSSEVGEEAQSLLRRAHAREADDDVVRRMTPEELQDVSGVGPGARWDPETSRAPPRSNVPERAPPVTTQDVLDTRARIVPGSRGAGRQGPEGMDWSIPRGLQVERRAVDRRLAATARAQERVNRDYNELANSRDRSVLFYHPSLYPEVGRSGRPYFASRDAVLFGGNRARAQQQAERLNNLWQTLRRLEGRREGLEARRVSLDRQWDEIRRRRIDAENRRIDERGAEEARIEGIVERVNARRQARQARLHAEGLEEARIKRSRETAERRARGFRDVRLPQGRPESYRTQFAAGERALREGAPNIQAPLMARSGGAKQGGALGQVINALGEEGRGALHPALRGYKTNEHFSKTTGSLHEGIALYLSDKLGVDNAVRITNILDALGIQRALGRFAQGTRNTDAIIRELGDMARKAKGEAAGIINRIRQGMIDDFERVTSAAPEGQEWQRRVNEFRRLTQQHIEEVEKPLREILQTDNPAAVAALLRASAREGGDINVLRAVLRTAEDKGNRTTAVGWFLHKLAEGGPIGFLRNWRAMSPEAKQELFRGAEAPLFRRFEQYARIAEQVERYGRGGMVRAARPGLSMLARDTAASAGLAFALGPFKAAVLLGGMKGADMIAASRPFQRWLTRMPTALLPKSAGRVRFWLGSLAGLGIVDAATGGQIAETIHDSIFPRAEAVVVGGRGAQALAERGRPFVQWALQKAQDMWRMGRGISEIRRVVDPVIARNEPEFGSVVMMPNGRWGIEAATVDATFFMPSVKSRRMRDVIDHPTLRTAYGKEFGTTGVRYRPEQQHSQAFDAQGPFGARIEVGRGPQGGEGLGDRRKAFVHELDHIIQGVEDFPPGSSPNMFWPGGPYRRHLKPGETPFQAYERTGGEWFARKAAERDRLTGQQMRDDPLDPPTDLLNLPRFRGASAESRPGPTDKNKERVEEIRRVAAQRGTGAQVIKDLANELQLSPRRVLDLIDLYAPEVRTKPRRVEWRQEGRLEKFKEVWNRHRSIPRVAEEMDLSPDQVASLVKRHREELGLRPAKRTFASALRRGIEQVREGRSLKDVAREAGINYQTLYSALRSKGMEVKSISSSVEKRKNKIQELLNSGMSIGGVSRELGVSRQAVSQYMRSYGIKLPPGKWVGGRRETEEETQRFLETVRRGSAERGTMDEVANETGSSRSRVFRAVRNEALPWRRSGEKKAPSWLEQPGAREAVMEMVNRQTPPGQRTRIISMLGNRFGVSQQSVRRAALKEGFEMYPRGLHPRPPRKGKRKEQAETRQEYSALELEERVMRFEDELKARGQSPDQIAAAINKRFNMKVTGEEIRRGEVWWRVGHERDTEFGAGGVEFDPTRMSGSYDPRLDDLD